MNKRVKGSEGEEKALSYLKENNYSIVEKNFRYSRLGEIDIIAKDGEFICFIEVKSRSNILYGYGREAVDYRKQTNIRKLAQIYINKYGLHNREIRFDVVEIYFENKNTCNISLYKNAF